MMNERKKNTMKMKTIKQKVWCVYEEKKFGVFFLE